MRVNLEDHDARLREIVMRIPTADREYLLQVLRAGPAERAEAIGLLHAGGVVPAAVELLIDAEEHRELRALLVGLLADAAR